ncbi:MAG: ABC transporter permease [Acidimicrobiia bacterium]|nr:ABC transporter permease [Acidimicrobiia bacterium]
MTAEAALRSPREIRRARYLGITYLVLSGFVLWFFGIGSWGEGIADFGMARPTDTFDWIPSLPVPAAAFAIGVAVVFAFMGGVQLVRGFGRWQNRILAIAFILFIFAFLGWAAAGQSFNLVGMLRTAVERSTPITFGALAGLLGERVAVINIAIEGQLLAGAFAGALVASITSNAWPGVVAAVLVGLFFGWVLAVLAIRYRVDQIIIGVVINIFVLGLTSFLTARILAPNPHLNRGIKLNSWRIPGLGDIPVIGPIFFDQTIFVYASLILVAVLAYTLFHTRWGLQARAVGEHPRAADTVGINVYRYRYLNVLLGGAVAGFGGAYFTIGTVGRFDENMTTGRGFIALAAMIFGRWHPVGALSAALIFGFADALAGKLGILQTGIPSEFLLMAPYIATLVVVTGIVGKARPPAADGQVYVKE